MDMSVSTDNNISVKKYNKISNYKDLEIETEKMWHLKTTTLSVIMGALDIIKTWKHINKISSRLYEIQKNSTFRNCSFP